MRILLSFTMMFTSTWAGADVPRAERRAMRRALLQLWPATTEPQREELIQRWAGEFHRQSAFDLRQSLVPLAQNVSALAKRAQKDGLNDDEIRRLVKDVTLAYQIAAAERYDDINYTTGVMLLGSATVPMLVLAAVIVFSSVDFEIDPLLSGGVSAASIALAIAGLIYTRFGAKPFARTWVNMPGANPVSKKFPGNDYLVRFWADVEAGLNDRLPETENERVRRPKEKLRDFAVSLQSLVSADALARACQAELDVTP